jgi:hypothetical protein
VETIRIDLTDPARLSAMLEEHLRVSVCPVAGVRFPGLLALVQAALLLPGGDEVTLDAQVIRRLPGGRFLLQFLDRLDLAHLALLATMSGRAARTPATAGPAAGHLTDAPWGTAGEPVTNRNRRARLPAPERGRLAPIEKSTQPPPKFGRPSGR